MNGRETRPARAYRILFGIGLLLTIGLVTPYRPWGDGPNPLNHVLVVGPILLAAAAASGASRRKAGGAAAGRPGPGTGGSAARVVLGVGLVLLLVGGCPWIYTPYLLGGDLGGKVDPASGMVGTIIFVFIGLPGLTMTAIGLVNLVTQGRE